MELYRKYHIVRGLLREHPELTGRYRRYQRLLRGETLARREVAPLPPVQRPEARAGLVVTGGFRKLKAFTGTLIDPKVLTYAPSTGASIPPPTARYWQVARLENVLALIGQTVGWPARVLVLEREANDLINFLDSVGYPTEKYKEAARWVAHNKVPTKHVTPQAYADRRYDVRWPGLGYVARHVTLEAAEVLSERFPESVIEEEERSPDGQQRVGPPGSDSA